MPKFTVKVPAIHNTTYEVEAADEEEAIKKIQRCEGKEVVSCRSHALDPDRWDVERKR